MLDILSAKAQGYVRGSMLSNLITTKMTEDKLSLRGAAKLVGISHATLKRAIDGEQLDLATMSKISTWLDVMLSEIVDLEGKNSSAANKIAMLIDRHPKLRDAFADALEQYEAGEIDASLIDEMIAYIAFRLKRT